jgi:WD40 repeat protein
VFSHNGGLAALADGDKWECQVWHLPPDPNHGSWTTENRNQDYFGLVFDPGTHELLYGSPEGMSGENGINGYSLEEVPGGPLRAFAVASNAEWLVYGSELRSGKSPKDNIAAQLVSYRHNETVWEGKQWKLAKVSQWDGFGFSDLAFFPDGKRFVSIEWSKRKRGPEYHKGDVPTLRVHDSKSLKERDATTFEIPVDELVVCRNSIVIRGVKSFRVWDGDDLAIKPTEVKTGKKPLAAIAADPQGRFVLTATGNAVSVWDANSWAVSKTYEWNAGKITCLAVSPDGLLAAAGTATGIVVVWDTE